MVSWDSKYYIAHTRELKKLSINLFFRFLLFSLCSPQERQNPLDDKLSIFHC